MKTCHIYFVISLFLLLSLSYGSYSKFESLYEYWKQVCSDIPENNVVLPSIRNEAILPAQRPWSLTGTTIHSVFKGKEGLKYCSNTKELVESIANKVEDYTCNIEWIGIDEICLIMQTFARFYFIGDSHLRHMTQALYMILTNDFRYGGYPKLGLNKPTPFDDCSCDGQFSDNIKCKDFHYNFNTKDVRNFGVCTHSPSESGKYLNAFTITVDLYDGLIPYSIDEICTYDYRPRIIYITGGTNYDTEPHLYYDNYLKPSLTSINADMAICPWRSKHFLFWTGVPYSSADVVNKRPNQAESKNLYFNAQVEAKLKTDFPMVHILNFYNLTKETTLQGRSSDGFHQLSDGNLIKSMILMNAIKFSYLEHLAHQKNPPLGSYYWENYPK